MINNVYGIISSLIAIISFGLLPIPFKAVEDPTAIQFFMSMSIFIISAPITLVSRGNFSWFGALGALIWVPASFLSILSVNLVGIGIAQTVWNIVSVITSFVLGISVLGEPFYYQYIPALILLVIGLGISSTAEVIFTQDRTLDRTKVFKYFAGIISATVMGLLNGCSMIPAKLGPIYPYIATFGLIQFLLSNTILLIYYMISTSITKFPTLTSESLRGVVTAGIMCGLLWSAGYAGQTVSVLSPYGLSVGFVSVQTCMIISSISGMIVYKELNNWKKKLQFAAGVIPIVVGVTLLYVRFV